MCTIEKKGSSLKADFEPFRSLPFFRCSKRDARALSRHARPRCDQRMDAQATNSGPDALGTPSVPTESSSVPTSELEGLQLMRSAGSASETTPEAELAQLLARVRQLAPRLSPEALGAAGRELVELAASRASGNSPAQPRMLAFGQDDGRPPDAGSEVGSVGSLEGEESADDRDSDDEAEALEQQDGCPRVGATEDDTESGQRYAPWDTVGWQPTVSYQSYQSNSDAAPFAAAAEDEEAEGEEGHEPRRMSGWRGARDLMGLADCQHVYCEKCDLGLTQDEDGCQVTAMALAGRVQRVQAKHEKLRTAKPWGDKDRREARHAMYKAIISWQFCSPLGAGKRVRLPKCLVSAVRRKFPNPVCGPGCDYWVQCERKGHYTGFRTAEESRAAREGRYQLVDIR